MCFVSKCLCIKIRVKLQQHKQVTILQNCRSRKLPDAVVNDYEVLITR